MNTWILLKKPAFDINRKHDLVDVIFSVISAIISGAEGWRDIETYGNSKADYSVSIIAFVNGIPRRHTIARILRCIVIDTLFEALLCWVKNRTGIRTL